MEMGDTFAAIPTIVDDQSVAGLVESKFPGDFSGFQKQVAEERVVRRVGFVDPGDRFFGNDEDVGGGLRMNVGESECQVVLVEDLGGDLTGDNFLEQGHER